jgi:hypothetical protein
MQIAKLRKENEELLKLVGILTLKLDESQKKKRCVWTCSRKKRASQARRLLPFDPLPRLVVDEIPKMEPGKGNFVNGIE